MRDIRGVVFDLDDTLYAERRYVLSGLRHVAQVVEADTGVAAADVWRAAVAAFRRGPRGEVLQTMCRRCGLVEDGVPRWVEALRGHSPALRLPRVSQIVLARLRAEGFRLGVLTNGLVEVQRRKVEALGIGTLVDMVICAESIAPGGKPATACFAAAAEALGLQARQLVMVGDAPVEDIAGAHGAGWRTVLVDRRGRSPQTPADAVVGCLAKVPDVIGRLELEYLRAC